MNTNKNFVGQVGMFAGLLVVGYGLWKSRYKIQEMLESAGIETPWMKDSISETVRSGAAKLKGSAKFEADRSAAI